MFKRYRFASIKCGEGQIHIRGITKYDGTFMKKHSAYYISDWMDQPAKEELKETIREWRRK